MGDGCLEDGIDQVLFLRARAPFARLDIWPFLVLEMVLFTLYFWYGPEAIERSVDVENGETRLEVEYDEYAVLSWMGVGVLAGALHAGALLAGFWSARARAALRFSSCSASLASHVCMVPSAHRGSPDICCIQESNNVEQPNCDPAPFDSDLPRRRFVFHGEMFSLSEDESVARLGYPINLKLGEYLAWPGYGTKGLGSALGRWGSNEFHIPLPGLDELFVEHALSPFFLFQMLCVGLWCLDEYWYYSVFTLVMLILFEVMVCKQRQLNIANLRNMRRPPYPICVFRAGQWSRVLSSELIPGDLCSVVRHGSAGGAVIEEDQVLMACDVVLLRGSCVVNEAMLTGESVPKMKESLVSAVAADVRAKGKELDFHSSECTHHIILGGTRVIQHSLAESETGSRGRSAAGGPPDPPDGGCPAFVLRTGFATSQGSLMRTILFSTERVTVENAETFLFLLCLLVFAVMASAYVLVEGLKNEGQSRWKLFLHCTMIITAAVPPELPLELSMAVNTSLARLQKLAIYCTEPYRIPLAGKLDICCFDKTGTLTSDSYNVRGVLCEGNLDAVDQLTPACKLDFAPQAVIAACHQLIRIGDAVDGDPMEQAGVLAVGWSMTKDGRMIKKAARPGGPKQQLRTVHRHPFSSESKRMSTVVFASEIGAANQLAAAAEPEDLLVLCKGAPEVLAPLLAAKPAAYDTAYQQLMLRGARVLALAYKRLAPSMSVAAVRRMPRQQVESSLQFAGFLVLHSPLKEDTQAVISQLRLSRHRIMVITGDSALTACDVARKVGVISQDSERVLTLTEGVGLHTLEWRCIDPARPLPSALSYAVGTAGAIEASGHALVVSGNALAALEQSCGSREEFTKALQLLAPHVAVFARVSPRDKETVLAALKAAGFGCLMCGDGTNDVGALKQADVGVSIVNSPEHEAALRAARDDLCKRVPESVLATLTPAERFRAELQQMEREQQGSSVVQLGDASIASPFTSKTTSTMATVHLVRAGRCTLVATIQMYKILALNCLISAYSLSALYLNGVKNGDTQAMLAGLLIAMLFMFIAWAEPLNELSPERPVDRIFSAPVIVSLIGQLAVHFAALFAVLDLTKPFVDANAEEMAPDADFKPNVINTAVFLVGLCMQCNVFGANYRGRPYMQSLRDNKVFHRVLGGTWALSIFLAMDISPEVGQLFELVPLPRQDNYCNKLVAVLLADTLFSYSWELICRAFFKS